MSDRIDGRKLVSPNGLDGMGPVPTQVQDAALCIAKLRIKFVHQWMPGMDSPLTSREVEDLFRASAIQAEWMRELYEARDRLRDVAQAATNTREVWRVHDEGCPVATRISNHEYDLVGDLGLPPVVPGPEESDCGCP